MSFKTELGAWQINWLSYPKGAAGVAQVEIFRKSKDPGHGQPQRVEIRWRSDASGLWLELPDGVYGFDIFKELDDDGRDLYRVSQRMSPNRWSGIEIKRAGEEAASAAAGGGKKAVRVRAQMPGRIVKVLVDAQVPVEKGQPLLIMEAMKMENQITAPQAGVVAEIKVQVGQVVETGADLVRIESERQQ